LILLFQEAATAIRQMPMLLLQPIWVNYLSVICVTFADTDRLSAILFSRLTWLASCLLL